MAKEGGGFYNLDDFAGLRGVNRWEARDEKGALVVRGYASKIFDHPQLATEIHLQKHLITVGNVLTDEYDVRTLLTEFHEADTAAKPIPLDDVVEYVEDPQCEDVALQAELEKERYLDLPASALTETAEKEVAWEPPRSLLETLPSSVTGFPNSEKRFLLLQHTARSIAAKPKLEALIVARQTTSDDFSFLRPGDRLNPLYEHLKLRFITARAKTSTRETRSRWGGEAAATSTAIATASGASATASATATTSPSAGLQSKEQSTPVNALTETQRPGQPATSTTDQPRHLRREGRSRSRSGNEGKSSGRSSRRRDSSYNRRRRRHRDRDRHRKRRSTSYSRSTSRSRSRSRARSRSRRARRRYSRSASRSRRRRRSRRRSLSSRSASSSRERDRYKRRRRGRRRRRSSGSSSSLSR